MIDEFLEHAEHVLGTPANTLRALRVDLTQFEEYLVATWASSLAEADGRLIEAYMAHCSKNQGHKASTIRRRWQSIRRFYRVAEAQGWCELDPSRAVVKGPRQQTRLPRPAKMTHIEQVLAAIPDPDIDITSRRDRALILFFLGTGCRVSEVAKVRIGDLEDDLEGVLIVGKGDKERLVAIPPGDCRQAVWDYIRWGRAELLPNTDHLFVGQNSEPMTHQSIRERFKKRCKEAGVDPAQLSPHMVRHTYGTEMVRAGADIVSVSAAMGHTKLDTTMGYVQVDGDQVRKTVLRYHPASLAEEALKE